MSTLIIVDQPPYGNWAGREALDMVFSLAAFDQPAALLFTGAGVNWLRKQQAPDAIGQRSVEKNLSAAPMFGVEEILADAASCERFGLGPEQLVSGVTLAENLQDVMNAHSNVAFAG